ncbi:TPA: hypothetical protein U1316_001650 [Streptococcus suis]|nr:hypothetical protein [Streptococcus suis]
MSESATGGVEGLVPAELGVVVACVVDSFVVELVEDGLLLAFVTFFQMIGTL